MTTSGTPDEYAPPVPPPSDIAEQRRARRSRGGATGTTVEELHWWDNPQYQHMPCWPLEDEECPVVKDPQRPPAVMKVYKSLGGRRLPLLREDASPDHLDPVLVGDDELEQLCGGGKFVLELHAEIGVLRPESRSRPLAVRLVEFSGREYVWPYEREFLLGQLEDVLGAPPPPDDRSAQAPQLPAPPWARPATVPGWNPQWGQCPPWVLRQGSYVAAWGPPPPWINPETGQPGSGSKPTTGAEGILGTIVAFAAAVDASPALSSLADKISGRLSTPVAPPAPPVNLAELEERITNKLQVMQLRETVNELRAKGARGADADPLDVAEKALNRSTRLAGMLGYTKDGKGGSSGAVEDIRDILETVLDSEAAKTVAEAVAKLVNSESKPDAAANTLPAPAAQVTQVPIIRPEPQPAPPAPEPAPEPETAIPVPDPAGEADGEESDHA